MSFSQSVYTKSRRCNNTKHTERSWLVSEACDLKYLTTVAFALMILKKEHFVSVTYGQITEFILLNNDTTSYFYYINNLFLAAV